MKAVSTLVDLLTPEHEHEFEAAHGLPEALPAGEVQLWQGSPEWKRLAQRAFHVRKLVVYFAAMMALRVIFMLGENVPPSTGAVLLSVLWMVVLACTAIGLLTLVAWLSARATVYTVTDRRVVMRIGIVLTLTFNIPFKRITGASLHLDADGSVVAELHAASVAALTLPGRPGSVSFLC